ncbi:hypothetical protein O181_049086, partial [Austropuccinia psidii MF-1]|nr:hypothetical protein [Austropuccinia psidii MF-1]
KPQTRGLEGSGSSSSAPPTPQTPFSMADGQQELQPGIPLGRNWGNLPEDLSQRDRLQRPYGNHQRLESHKGVQTPGAPHWPHTIQEPADLWPRVAICHNPTKFPGEDKDKTEKKYYLQQKEERFRSNDPEAVGFGEINAQKPEVAVHNSRISSTINRNITPTKIEHNFVTPESNLNSDAL